MQKNKTITTLMVAVSLFLLLLPLSLKIDFSLHPWVAPTFYAQGMLALVFAKGFGLSRLPVLTLLVSILNFFLVTEIVRRFLNKSITTSVLAGLLFLFNPVTLYLTWGFMSGHYFLLFCLIAIYLFLEGEKNKDITIRRTLTTSLSIVLELTKNCLKVTG